MTHPTADHIYKALENKFPNMSVATVYNNFRVLRETGLALELAYGKSIRSLDCNVAVHYHIICNTCGQIVDFQYPSLDEVEALAEQVTGCVVSHQRMEIYGTCNECQMVESKNH